MARSCATTPAWGDGDVARSRDQGRFAPLGGGPGISPGPALTAAARNVAVQSGLDEETALSAEPRNWRFFRGAQQESSALAGQAVCANCFRTSRAFAFSRTSSLRASAMRTTLGGFPTARSVS